VLKENLALCGYVGLLSKRDLNVMLSQGDLRDFRVD
jgi:hypothetical protein